jgi:hypothetical protein
VAGKQRPGWHINRLLQIKPLKLQIPPRWCSIVLQQLNLPYPLPLQF